MAEIEPSTAYLYRSSSLGPLTNEAPGTKGSSIDWSSRVWKGGESPSCFFTVMESRLPQLLAKALDLTENDVPAIKMEMERYQHAIAQGRSSLLFLPADKQKAISTLLTDSEDLALFQSLLSSCLGLG